MFIPYKLKMLKRRIFMHSEGENILKTKYRALRGKDFDEQNLQTFTDKMFNRMILTHRYRRETYTDLSDKILARDYIKNKVGEQYLVKLIWQGTDPKEIPFNTLPERCVIKTNHGSGTNLVINGNLDKEKTIRTLAGWLKGNHYWESREYQYYRIKPQILIEEYVDDGRSLGPLDYRFWCFNGTPKIIQVDNHRHNINPFYDAEWNKLDLSYRDNFDDTEIEKPSNLDKMLEIASLLSSDFDYVRVDLYNAKGHILFGELTFTPIAGGFKFHPEEWDLRLGQMWEQQQN